MIVESVCEADMAIHLNPTKPGTPGWIYLKFRD